MIVKAQACVCGLSTFSNVHANKGNSILLGSFHSEIQVLVARVQFIEKNVDFVEVWNDCESIIHIPFIEGGERISMKHMKVLANSGPSGEPMAMPSTFS